MVRDGRAGDSGASLPSQDERATLRGGRMEADRRERVRRLPVRSAPVRSAPFGHSDPATAPQRAAVPESDLHELPHHQVVPL
jgi:hypothetical protein